MKLPAVGSRLHYSNLLPYSAANNATLPFQLQAEQANKCRALRVLTVALSADALRAVNDATVPPALSSSFCGRRDVAETRMLTLLPIARFSLPCCGASRLASVVLLYHRLLYLAACIPSAVAALRLAQHRAPGGVPQQQLYYLTRRVSPFATIMPSRADSTAVPSSPSKPPLDGAWFVLPLCRNPSVVPQFPTVAGARVLRRTASAWVSSAGGLDDGGTGRFVCRRTADRHEQRLACCNDTVLVVFACSRAEPGATWFS